MGKVLGLVFRNINKQDHYKRSLEMPSPKSTHPMVSENSFPSEPGAVSNFVWKSIGAALCGAAIPGVIFYFLF